MKTQDMFRRVLTVLGLAAALALAPAPGRAQSDNAPPTVREDPAAPRKRNPPRRRHTILTSRTACCGWEIAQKNWPSLPVL